MLKRYAIIPTGSRPEEYKSVIDWCEKHDTTTVTIATTIEAVAYSNGLVLLDDGEINISRWWKKGLDIAWKNGAEIVAVFNDDAIPGDDWWEVIEAEIGDNSGASGMNHNGGMMGWAFAINDKNIVPDERIKWYETDSVIQRLCEKASGFKLIPSIEVANTHARSSEDFMGKQIEKDYIEYNKYYGNK